MKKNSKQFIANNLMIVVAAAVLILIYVSTKLMCESLVREKVTAQEQLNNMQSSRLSLTAQYQLYNSEEYIINAAETLPELQMVKGDAPLVRYKVSTEKIERIQKEIDSRYE